MHMFLYGFMFVHMYISVYSYYFCVMHPGVILGLRGSILNDMTNVDIITSK